MLSVPATVPATVPVAAKKPSGKKNRRSQKNDAVLEPVAPTAVEESVAVQPDVAPESSLVTAESPVIVGTNAAAAPTQAGASPGSAYVSIVAKRLRTLKKRLSRVEKYEEDIVAGLADKLNEDQRLAVEKKGEVVLVIKELEEMLKQMEDKDAEDLKAMKKAKRAEQIEKQKMLAAAVELVQTQSRENMLALVRYFFAANALLPHVPASVVSQVHKDAVLQFVQSLVGSTFGAQQMQELSQTLSAGVVGGILGMRAGIDNNALARSANAAIAEAMNGIDKWIAQSEEIAVHDLSYKQVQETVDRIFVFLETPPPKFMVTEEVEQPIVDAVAAQEDPTAHGGAAALLEEAPVYREEGTVTFGSFSHAGGYDLTSRASVHYDPAIIVSSMVHPPPLSFAPIDQVDAANAAAEVSSPAGWGDQESTAATVAPSETEASAVGVAPVDPTASPNIASLQPQEPVRKSSFKGGKSDHNQNGEEFAGRRGSMEGGSGKTSFRGARGRGGRGGFRGKYRGGRGATNATAGAYQ